MSHRDGSDGSSAGDDTTILHTDDCIADILGKQAGGIAMETYASHNYVSSNNNPQISETWTARGSYIDFKLNIDI